MSWTTKALIRLRGCAGWSAPMLFAYDKQVFSWCGSYKNRTPQDVSAYNTLVCPNWSMLPPYGIPTPRKKDRKYNAELQDGPAVITKLGSVSLQCWRSLAGGHWNRRAFAHLSLFYDIVYGLVAIPTPEYIKAKTRFSRNCHCMTFCQVHTVQLDGVLNFPPIPVGY